MDINTIESTEDFLNIIRPAKDGNNVSLLGIEFTQEEISDAAEYLLTFDGYGFLSCFDVLVAQYLDENPKIPPSRAIIIVLVGGDEVAAQVAFNESDIRILRLWQEFNRRKKENLPLNEEKLIV